MILHYNILIIRAVFFFLMILLPPRSTQGRTLFPYTTLFRSERAGGRRSRPYARSGGAAYGSSPATRSEEHTSELQSPFLISYAVFCLQKKTAVYGISLRSSFPPIFCSSSSSVRM